VHVRPEVGEKVGRAVVDVTEDLDFAALLGDEDAPVGGELDRRWVGETRKRQGGFLEAPRQRTRSRAPDHKQHEERSHDE
jgi:hypothetical protein